MQITRRSVSSTILATLLCSIANAQQPAAAVETRATPPAEFTDPNRRAKITAALPAIEKVFDDWVARANVPGAVMGLIVDGELVWVKGAGVREAGTKEAVTPDTVFRIASMTKSFTAMSILRLRDEGKLSLDDPAAKYIPELAGLKYPTTDSPVITIRHLLTHGEGFPEDNPWGDRQMGHPDAVMNEWMRKGIPFSTVPGTEFEYSNYGFAILGQIVARVSGIPYDKYVRENIFVPLGMTSTTLHTSEVPRDRIAPGYRWEDGAWKPEPMLDHGSFGAMGGIWTSARDLSKYVAFHMNAFPPRDGKDDGPIRRSSAREMQSAWRTSGGTTAFRRAVDSPLELSASSYGYGLGVGQDCRFKNVVAHSGGLPGFGSLMLWLPEYGVGVIGMSNKTYTSPGRAMQEALVTLHKAGAIEPRTPRPSQALLSAQRDVSSLVANWDSALANRIAADNLFLDETPERRAAQLKEQLAAVGKCSAPGPIKAENALRGTWDIPCERGRLEVTITLAPTSTPLVQSLDVAAILEPDATMSQTLTTVLQQFSAWDQTKVDSIVGPGVDKDRLKRQTEAARAWGICASKKTYQGNGSTDTAVMLECEKGKLILWLSLDATTKKVKDFAIVPSRDPRCVP